MPRLSLQIDRSKGQPLYLQIAEQLDNLICVKELRGGDRLPSLRELAAVLGVNRNTVGLAYHVLERSGLVQSRIGSGTFVTAGSGRGGAGGEGPARAGGTVQLGRALSRRSLVGENLLERLSLGDGESRIDLSGSVADSDFFPAEEFRAVLSEVVREMGPSVLDYGSREGYSPLRGWLARRLASQGALVAEKDLFILNGSQQGLDLVGKLLLDEGDAVVVESPTYYNAIGAFRLYGTRLLPVPLDDSGMRVDLLEGLLSRREVKLIYCMPTFQNPTGVTMPRKRREEVVGMANRYGVPLLEDNFDADLRYQGEADVHLKGMPSGENVLLLGTFSKILFPGLRLGWLAVPPVFREPFRRIRAYSDLAAGLLAQAAIHRFCEEGYLDRHLDRVRGENRQRLGVLLESMEEYFPEEVHWTRPDGGMSLWVTLPRSIEAVEVLLEARRAGVNFSPGGLFHVDGGGSHAFRLSFTLERAERITEGVRRIGSILRRRLTDKRSATGDVSNVLL